MSASNLVQYYADRAPEYERIYSKPERQADLATLRELVANTFAGSDVLEVACGTGYWTDILAQAATSVLATDINDEVLEIARRKPRIIESSRVNFARTDAYTFNAGRKFSGCLAAFWWSHIPKARIRSFLEVLHFNLRPGATVLFIDNRFVRASSTPIHREDSNGNSYQLRSLSDGTTHEVLKNFPAARELVEAVAPFAENTTVTEFEYYWTLRYEARG